MSSFRSKLTLSLGSVISAQVDLHSVLPSTKSQTRMLCGEHTEPVKMAWQCPGKGEAQAHYVYGDQIVRGVENAEGWTIVTGTKPEVEIDKKTIGLVPIPAVEVERNTFVGEAIYYLTPSGPSAHQVWQILAGIVKKGKVALITKAAFTPNEKMYRLDTFRDYLVLRELVYPDKIADTPAVPEGKVDKAMTTLVDQFVDNLLTSWDGFDSSDANTKRFDAWIATGKTVINPDVPVKEQGNQAADLMETLKRAVESAQKKS